MSKRHMTPVKLFSLIFYRFTTPVIVLRVPHLVFLHTTRIVESFPANGTNIRTLTRVYPLVHSQRPV